MFEDVKKEPEDILSGVDKGAPPPTLPVGETPKPLGVPVAPKPGVDGPPQIEKPLAVPEITEPRVFWKKFVIIAAVVVVLGGAVTFLIIRKPAVKPEATPAPEAVAPEAPAVAPEAVPETPTAPAAEVTPPAPVDTDGDGLTDDEEAVLGTNPASADSDDDGLSDREEVKVYLTDPLNPDTDGDSYPDGTEVKNGYDPKGPGKLFTVPAPQ
jgi:hypothetical protein